MGATIAILGAGGVGLGTAALLAGRGHRVTLWSPTARGAGALAGVEAVTVEGKLAGRFPVAVAPTLQAALHADWLVVAAPVNAHGAMFAAMAPLLGAHHRVVVGSMASLSALALDRLAKARGLAPLIVGLATTATTGRRVAPGQARVMAVRAKIDGAALNADAAPDWAAALAALTGAEITVQPSLLGVELSNLNPISHAALALTNLAPMELGQAWDQYAVMTPAVCRMIEAMDAERLALAGAFGLEVRTIHQHFHWSFGLRLRPLAEMVAERRARGDGPAGPTSLDTRYVTEDLPFGLATTLALARLAGRAAPLHAGALALIGAAYGRDFAAENDLWPALAPALATAADAQRLATHGYPR